ncbi:hypothetical protein [Pseudomonas aeruginosa]|uniref:hypothetical protein n=1 Tax=Pseudomonas aeruginosa TaxID=287 RepID=UPI00128F82F9|nr:hypothetical protein [Pseudomonas aeruginosa]
MVAGLVGYGQQRLPSVVGAVVQARDGGRPCLADGLSGLAQQVDIAGRVEWLDLTLRVDPALDDVGSRQIGSSASEDADAAHI